MTDIKDQILQRAGKGLRSAADFVETKWYELNSLREPKEPRQIVAYTGYGNGRQIWVRGRVLADEPVRPSRDDDSWWDNLRASYARWETDEVEGVLVELNYGSRSQVVYTDSEGYYEARFDVQARPGRHEVDARTELDDGELAARHIVWVADPNARFMVISDMDDTVIETGITRKTRAARLTFLRNARTRTPLPGVAQLYRELTEPRPGAPRNPVFYVSNSGWNMYEILREFIEINDIPRGPLLLRDLGTRSAYGTSENHKAETFRRLLRRFSDLPVVLIGDSGQHDASLYAAVANEFPGRVMGIYIRDVDPDVDSPYDASVDAVFADHTAMGVPMVRGEDSEAFATHMRSVGLLSPEEYTRIALSDEAGLANESR